MFHPGKAAAGQFCWLDLAANDANRAKAFYARLFGWAADEQSANGGSFARLHLAGEDVGSLYQLRQAHLDRGVTSHWTPYVRVEDVDNAVRQPPSLGGQVIVRPFVVSGIARIALILDAVGAHVGLWETIAPNAQGSRHGKESRIRKPDRPRIPGAIAEP